MLCEECNSNEATIHFTQMTNGQKNEMNLCKECAAKKGALSTMGTVENIVSKFMSDIHNVDNSEDSEILVCKNCGNTYKQFQKTGRLGCSECYRTFEDKLKNLLRKIHGSNKHVGKTPFQPGGSEQSVEYRLEDLHEQLQKAIQKEQFEEAAVLRDEIKSLEELTQSIHKNKK